VTELLVGFRLHDSETDIAIELDDHTKIGQLADRLEQLFDRRGGVPNGVNVDGAADLRFDPSASGLACRGRRLRADDRPDRQPVRGGGRCRQPGGVQPATSLPRAVVGGRERERERYGFEAICDAVIYSHEEGMKSRIPPSIGWHAAVSASSRRPRSFVDDTDDILAGALDVGMTPVKFIGQRQTIVHIEAVLAGRAGGWSPPTASGAVDARANRRPAIRVLHSAR
jgi:hypothetical protein